MQLVGQVGAIAGMRSDPPYHTQVTKARPHHAGSLLRTATICLRGHGMQSSTTDFDLLADGELFTWRSHYWILSGTASDFVGELLKAACSLHAVSDQQSNTCTQ